MANPTTTVKATPDYVATLMAAAKRGDKELTSFGIIDARGRDVIKAQSLMDGDASRYFPSLMHVVCRVDGKRKPIEYFEDLPMGTFSKIMVALNDEGFTE